MIIAGGPWQMALIRRASDMGLRTVVTDRSPDAPGRAVADVFHCIDMHDVGGLLRIARDERVDLVISDQTDRAVPVVARLNAALELPGIRPETALRFTNKKAMRRALQGAGIPLPRHTTAGSLDEARSAAAKLGYPLVIKPLASQSSIGVFRIDDERQLVARFDACRAESGGEILVEEYIDGPEITVEGMAIAGRHHILAISEKAHYPELPCVAFRLAYPAHLNGEMDRTLSAIADRAIEARGLIDGLTHAEYRLRDGTPYLLEVAARGCGHGVVSTIVAHASGVDVYGVLLRRLMGEDVDLPPLRRRAGLLEFFRLRPGRVRAVRGLEEARRRGLAHCIHLPLAPGDTISPPTNDTDRGGYFIVLDETRQAVETKADEIRQLVQVVCNEHRALTIALL